ncbi:MAG TPA: hypothetical protein VK196_22335 [Magnetospirillum sp.]|nr:hypothetical protein [Magnetospirillum sp.]
MEQTVNETQKPDKDQTYWRREIERAEKHFRDKWWPTADKLYRKYAKQGERSGKREFCMIWANTEVLKPAIYARPPVPQVSRRYRDKDPVGRTAAEILERAASYEFERMNIDSALRAIRDDLLIPGRGVAWLRYEADIEAPEAVEPQEPAMATEPGEVTGHRVVVDYVHYRQFLHQPVRRWEEVDWVAKAAYMTEAEGKERFGAAWKGVELDNKADSAADSEAVKDPSLVGAQSAKATVYEIWCKSKKQTIFMAKACDHLLEVGPPLLDFEGFFPCPKPVYTTTTNNSLLPTPDYAYYQDQAEEIDDLTDRIDRLTDNLKLVGFYPAGAEGDVSTALETALSPDTQNRMIPIASWAAFGERGGGNAIVWLPIKDVVEVIKSCVELRNQIIQDTYQITGISDILRGQTESSETATAQSIKAQWGSVRIRDRQQEMARIARDITRMTCEIISEQFDPEYVLRMANIERPQPPAPPQLPPPSPPPQPSGDPQQDQMAMQQAQQQQQMQQQAMQQYQQALQKAQAENQKIDEAFAILKDDRLRGFRVDIETDSTIQPDEDAEKQRRTEFVTAIGGLIQQAAPLVMQIPELAPLVQETLLFTARGFRAGRQLEDSIEQAMQAVQDRISQQMSQQQQQGDPKAAESEARAKQMQAETEHKTQLWGQERQHLAQKAQIEIGVLQQKAQADMALKQNQFQMDQMLAEQEHAARQHMMRQEGEMNLMQQKRKMDLQRPPEGY